jgi:hypothetical protein
LLSIPVRYLLSSAIVRATQPALFLVVVLFVLSCGAEREIAFLSQATRITPPLWHCSSVRCKKGYNVREFVRFDYFLSA